MKGNFYYVLSSKNRLIAEKRLYGFFEKEFGKNPDIDTLLLKTKQNFYLKMARRRKIDKELE